MSLQFRLVRQNAIQTTIQARIVDLAFFDPQQVIQRRRRIPALFDWRAGLRASSNIREDGSHVPGPHPGLVPFAGEGAASDGDRKESARMRGKPIASPRR